MYIMWDIHAHSLHSGEGGGSKEKLRVHKHRSVIQGRSPERFKCQDLSIKNQAGINSKNISIA